MPHVSWRSIHVLSSFRALSRYWRLLVHYLSPHKVQIALLAVILCIAIGVQIATPRVASEFIDRAIAGEPLRTLTGDGPIDELACHEWCCNLDADGDAQDHRQQCDLYLVRTQVVDQQPPVTAQRPKGRQHVYGSPGYMRHDECPADASARSRSNARCNGDTRVVGR